MVPAPDSGTGSHRRAPHSGHSSLGGTARAPQPPQRMAVSAPSRTCSKNRPRVSVDSVTTEQTDEHGRGVAAERVGEAASGALDLTRSCLAAQLRDDLADLRGARRSNRMAFGLQPARWVHRNLAAEAGPAFLGSRTADSRLEEAKPFGRDDLRDGEAVVQLDDVDVCRADPRLTVGRRRRSFR